MIALPVIFANILQTVYQLIDTFWVGRLGTQAVAAVSLSFPILFFLISLAMGFAMAGSILIAQYNGKGDKENVCLTAGQTFSLVTIFAFILSVIGFFSSKFLLSLMTNDPQVLIEGTSYLQISFIAMIFMFIYNIFQSLLRGLGEVKLPLIIISVTVFLNFFLDPLFMFGWKFIPTMGVSGVALATLITQLLSAFVGVFILFKGYEGIRIRLSDLKIRFSWISRLFKLGLPSSIEFSSRSFGMVLITFIVSTLGTVTVASYGIGTRILSFIIIPAIGLSIASSALIGNNLGAKQYKRSEEIAKTGMKIGFWSLTIFGILLFIFAKSISSFFVPNELELISQSTSFIRYMSLTFGFIGITMVVMGTLKAAGKTTTAMFIAILQTLSLFVLSILLTKVFNLAELGIWIAYPITNFLVMSVGYYIYQKKEWLKKSLV